MIQVVLKQNKNKEKNKNNNKNKNKVKVKKDAEGEYIFAKSSITHHDFQEETG